VLSGQWFACAILQPRWRALIGEERLPLASVTPTGDKSSLPTRHRGDGKRFVARSDEKLTAFLELERVTRESLRSSNVE